MNGQFHAPAALHPVKEPLAHTEKEAGWAPELIRMSFPMPAIKPQFHSCPPHILITYTNHPNPAPNKDRTTHTP